MNPLEALSIGVSVLGWSLLHFVWQAAIVAALYALLRALLPRGNPRYVAALLALVAMAACPVATAWHELADAALTAVQPAGIAMTAMSAVAGEVSHPAAVPVWRAWLAAALPWLVMAWVAGVAVLGVRVYRQWRGLRRMLAVAERLPEWQARAREFAARLGLRRVVPVLASVRVATPTLVGWLKPAVVLPLAVLARMPPAQIDLILAHELAHLRRLDHLANLFQVVLETLFFYHPAVHWISNDARNERELCCDALALRVTGGQRRDFVAALAGLEEFRAGRAELALAASGGVLVERAWFIVGDAPRRKIHHSLRSHAALLLAAGVLVVAGWSTHQATWRQRDMALVATNNSAVQRLVRHDLAVSLAWSSPARPIAGPHLLPVPRALAAEPPTPRVAPTPIRIAAVEEPALTLAALAPRRAPAVAAVVAPANASITASTTMQAPAVGAPALHPRHTVPPVYPPQAMLAGLQGQVTVEFTLDAAGVPHDLAVVGNRAGPLDAAALQALGQWRFAPPAVSGRRYRQTFTFQLDAGNADATAPAPGCRVATGTHICRRL